MKFTMKIASLVFAAFLALAGFSTAQAQQAPAGTIFGVPTATVISVGIVGALAISTFVDTNERDFELPGDGDDDDDDDDTPTTTTTTN